MGSTSVATLTTVIGHTNLYYKTSYYNTMRLSQIVKKEWVDYGFAIF